MHVIMKIQQATERKWHLWKPLVTLSFPLPFLVLLRLISLAGSAYEMCTFQSKWLQELMIAAKRVWILIAHFH